MEQRIQYTWKPTESYPISGSILLQFSQFANTFRPIANMVTTIDNYFSQLLAEGHIQGEYIDEQGNVISKEEMSKLVEQIREQVASSLETGDSLEES